jgi:hypothetical protein
MISELERAASMSIAGYDPAVVVAAVNALQPLGKDAALACFAELLDRPANFRAEEGLFWVLRVLFDMPVGEIHPPVGLGAADIAPPGDAAALPRFPVVLACDVPLLAVRGYILAGLPDDPRRHVVQFRARGILRSSALAPEPAQAPQVFREAWFSAYGAAPPPAAMSWVEEQCRRLAG